MRFSQLRRCRTLLLLVACIQVPFLLGHGILQGAVLCVGSDGHVALESAVPDGDCGSSSQFEQQEAAAIIGALNTSDHCGPCLDVGVPGETRPFTSPGQNRSQHLQPHPPALVSSLTAYSERPPGTASLHSPSCLSVPLKSLRSVVLLI